MKCDKARRLLSQVLDGAAGRWTRARLQRHLARCEQCAKALESLRAVNGALKSVADAPFSAHPDERYYETFWGRLQPRLGREGTPGALPGLAAWRLAVAAAVAAAAAFLAITAVWEHRRAASLRASLDSALSRVARLEEGARGPAADVRLITDGAVTPGDKTLFHEMDLTFASDLKWVATDGRKIDMGLTHTISPKVTPALSAGGERAAAVQVAVFEEKDGKARLLSEARILARNGCKADFTTEAEGLTFRYECTPFIESDREAVLKLGVAAFGSDGEERALAGASLRIRSGQEAELARILSRESAYSVRVGLGLWQPGAEAH